ncbi:MAG: S8 family serine peptidase, partial [Gemmatimonadaceae bacterium]
ICYDFPIEPMLDVSRVNIQADRVHNGDGGVGPYTGDSVKVAVVDDGIDYSHPRLPSVDSVNEKDFSTDDCQGPGNRCTRGHGTFVAGVIFTQPDQGDGYVGIAYDANVVNAKVATSWPDTGCPYAGHCPPEQGCSYPLSPGWSRELEAFMWAAVPSVQETRPEADVINYSRGKFFEDDQENDTRVDHVSALNVDWVIHASGASFAHS